MSSRRQLGCSHDLLRCLGPVRMVIVPPTPGHLASAVLKMRLMEVVRSSPPTPRDRHRFRREIGRISITTPCWSAIAFQRPRAVALELDGYPEPPKPETGETHDS